MKLASWLTAPAPVAEVEEHCFRLMELLTNRSEEKGESISNILTNLIAILTSGEVDDKYELQKYGLVKGDELVKKLVKKLVECFEKAGMDINIGVDLVETVSGKDGLQEVTNTYTIGDLISLSLKEGCHQTIASCNAFDKKKGVCRNDIPYIVGTQSHTCICTFHQYDSNITHLVMASIFSALHAINRGMDDDQIYFAFFLGLLHDIAKPNSIKITEIKTKQEGGLIFPTYPAHGELGAKSLRALFSEKMSFSWKQWYAMTVLISQHMCGYHGANDGQNLLKRALLRHVNLYNEMVGFDLIPFLSILAFADGVGKFPAHIKDPAIHLKNCTEFEQNMMTNFDFGSFLQKVSYDKTKIVVEPIGRSGTGKSIWTKSLVDLFESGEVIICSSDKTTAFCTVGLDERLEGNAYGLMYDIYSLTKQIHSKAVKGNKKQKDDLLVKLKEMKKTWNEFRLSTHSDYQPLDIDSVSDLGQQVNERYKQVIKDALADPSIKIVILDTMITYFGKAAQFRFPDEIKSFFKIHVHVDSFVPITGSNGYDTKKQIEIGGEFSITRPLHPSVFKKDLKLYQSASANMRYEPGTSIAQPDLMLSVCRTPSKNLGYNESFQIIQNFVDRLTDSDMEEKKEVNPDLVDCDLNLAQYVEKHWDSNFSDTMGKQGFFCKNPIQLFESKIDTLKNGGDTYFKLLSNFTVLATEKGVMDQTYTASELRNDRKLVESVASCLMTIKYQENSFGERMWRNKWARQARGTILFRHPTTGKVTVLCYKLQRGAEVVTNSQKKSGIEETENWKGNTEIFDDEQRATIDALLNDKAFETYATSKGDGSLCVFTVYTGFAKDVMDCVIESFGSNLAKMMREQSATVSKGQYLVTMTTQGIAFDTMFNLSGMSPYMVESVLVGSGLIEEEEFKDFAKTHTHVATWNKWGSGFIMELLGTRLFFNDGDEIDSQSFMFEAICSNRRDSFDPNIDSLGGQEHTELAMSYDKPMLYFLGTSICSRFAYIPHMLYREICIKDTVNFPVVFREPLWWHIKDDDGQSTLSDLLRGNSQVLRHQIAKYDLLQQFPPSNVGFDYTDEKLVNDTPLDVEGLVLMTPKRFKFDNSDLFQKLGIPDLDYSKAKTNEYYKCHKFKEVNIKYYIELHEYDMARRCFPIVVRVAFFFGPGNLTSALQTIGSQTMALLDGTAVNSTSGQSYRSKYISTFPEKAQTGFDKRNIDTQCRMLINVGDGFAQDLIPIFRSSFPAITIDPEKVSDVSGVFRSTVMELKPWSGTTDEYTDRVSNLDSDSIIMKKLAGLVLGFSI